ncbi:TRAP transporter substrate-binding protein DctP [Bosea sp. (in: a-proteobacteria)]|uniref:TRAP transporter substrate-binding protein DctP n=1 Tax=Bosea sp. (in: a-proteobacteria) TaxID=1871050 RepID=UPI002DDCD13A|nr:TRAP transporter substrate-binding protein DctP [Bosea sp. (in: a-proteobacteria)]HEV2510111.1 TRAP transporter substrate-binding protein DctP [Bosea sp. (in: a-proteobacteria)]
MKQGIDRRALLAAGGAFALTGGAAFAQAKSNLRFSAVFSEQDIRAEMMKRFGEAIKDDFTLQPYYGGNLFKQGTELVAMQRNNLEMGNIAPQDVSNQIPAWSIVTSAYLFRDADHLKKVFASPVGAELKTMAEDKLNIKILGPTYFGARQVGLKPKKKVNTPADLAGVKLRMPGGDAWQFLGQSLGANPTPMAYAEVYTGLQSGAIDGQDNPLPNVQNMKFYEVSSQIVLTSHLVGFDLLCVTKRVWDGMDAKKQAAFQAAADAAIDWSTKEHLSKEAELVDFFKKQGLEVYTPDLKAFRDFAQRKYLASELAKGWVPGMIDKINAL